MPIFLESYDVNVVGQHLYIVYKDDAGAEYVIRGGPENEKEKGETDPDYAARLAEEGFGKLVVEDGVEIKTSRDGGEDRFSPEQRGSVSLDLGGRDDADVWQTMKDQAALIDQKGLDYLPVPNPLTGEPAQNSNSVVSSVLKAAGIDPYSVALPTNAERFEFVGRENVLLAPPEITAYYTFQEGDLIFLSLHYTDPNGDAEGFGFRGVKGSGWAEETHPFSDPSYGRVSDGTIAYPFNHLAASDSPVESDVEAWIYDKEGLRSDPVTVHLRSQSQVLKEVAEATDPIPTDEVPFFKLGGSNTDLDLIGGTAM